MPESNGLIFRRRLLDQLRQVAPKAVVWIAAPPGAGKSALATTWLHSSDAPVSQDHAIWYRVDAADEDPASFFRTLKLALRQVPGAPAERLPDFLPDSAGNVRGFAEAWFAILFGGEVDAPYAFVFDDIHRVAPDAPLFTVLVTAAGMMRGRDRLLCLSRQPPPQSVTSGLPRSRLFRIDDLLVHPEEFEDFRRAREQAEELTHEMFRAQLRQAGHWIADLNITSPSQSQLRQLVHEPWSRAPHILPRCTESEREALLATAFLQIGHEEEWERLGGRPAATAVLRLADERVFVTRLPNGAFRKHDLFHRWLQMAAEHTLPTEALQHARAQAGNLLAAGDQLIAGARLLAQAGAFEDIRDLVIKRASDLNIAGRNREILKVIDLLPRAASHDPPIRVLRAYGRLPFEPQWARAEFASIWRGVSPPAEPFAYAGALLGEVRSALEDWSIDQRLAALVEESATIAGLLKDLPDWACEWVTVARSLAILIGQPTHPEAPRALTDLEAILPQLMPPLQIFALTALATWYLRGRGDLAAARVHLSALRALHEHKPTFPSTRVMGYSAALGAAFRDGDADAMREIFEEAKAFAYKHGISHKLQGPFSLMGQAYAVQKNRAAAADALYRFEHSSRQSRRTGSAAQHSLRAAIALSFGDVDHALAEASLAHGQAVTAGWDQGVGNQNVLLATAYAVKGDARARCFIQQLRDEGGRSQNRVFLFHADLAETCLAFAQDQAREFVRAWAQLGSTACTFGFRWFSGMDTAYLGAMASRALELGADPAVTRRLVELWRLTPPEGRPVHEDWPYRVQIACLGGFSIRVDGSKLRSSPGKAQRKPLELLWLLIVAGDRGIAQEHVADQLWPDLDGDRAMHTLRTTLYRLRKLVGAESVIQEDEHIQLNPAVVATDLSYLQAALARMRDSRLTPDELRTALDQALRLYRGPLLPGIDLDAVVESRLQVAATLATEAANALAALDPSDPATMLRWTQLQSALPGVRLPDAPKWSGRAGTARH